MIYKVWSVYELDGKVRHYVINTTTKKIQSAWESIRDAYLTANSLNASQDIVVCEAV